MVNAMRFAPACGGVLSSRGKLAAYCYAHPDSGMGTITRITRDDTAVWYTIQASPSILRYIIEKGSIAIDGISLTVAQIGTDHFSISAIPHTVAATTLSERRTGDSVNLENDMIGKYVEKLFTPSDKQKPTSTLTKEFLSQCGY